MVYAMLVVLLISPCLCKARIARPHPMQITSTLGIGFPILDNGYGLHFGLNPTIPLNRHLSIAGQLSYMYGRINSSFLSGNHGLSHTGSLMMGGRVYIGSGGKGIRTYFNTLLGPQLHAERINNLMTSINLNLGGSIGGFVRIRPWVIGLSYETPGHVVFKTGYYFIRT